MKSMYDVQQILKRYGIFIYTGNRLSDLQLMELEINELYQHKLITIKEFTEVKMVISKEIQAMKK